ncbi:hypothetical protein ACFLSZ_02680 [Candidatus Bipolaricaulota bacterium]
MRQRIIGIMLGGIILFAAMAFVYPAICGQDLIDVPWIIISAIAAAIAAPIADFLTRRRRRKRQNK